MNVLITGCGRTYALGYNLVLRYLEAGDTVVATVRTICNELEELKKKYEDRLHILLMDVGSTASVNLAANTLTLDSLDLIINNAVAVSKDNDKEFFDVNLDFIQETVNVTSVGALRVIKAFYPYLKKSNTMALICNISSEAGSISTCFRTNCIEYGMAKAALNMATMNLNLLFKNENINIFAVHPGWIRTNGDPSNQAPLSSYDAAEILRILFEKKRFDKDGPRFIDNEGNQYPF